MKEKILFFLAIMVPLISNGLCPPAKTAKFIANNRTATIEQVKRAHSNMLVYRVTAGNSDPVYCEKLLTAITVAINHVGFNKQPRGMQVVQGKRVINIITTKHNNNITYHVKIPGIPESGFHRLDIVKKVLEIHLFD